MVHVLHAIAGNAAHGPPSSPRGMSVGFFFAVAAATPAVVATGELPLLKSTKSRLALASLLALGIAPALADGIADGFSRAIKQSDTTLSFRYRYESVDQDGLPQDANASTLLSRLTWKSGTVRGVSGLFEVDN